jgi:aminobenzoyl-glutamate utilization protein B
MTDTTVTWHQIDGTANTLSNQVLEKLLHDNLTQAPLPEYTEKEMTFAKALKATFGPCELPGDLTKNNPQLKKFVMEKTANGTAVMNNFIMPYIPSFAFAPGSTDVGDVSWLTPTAQFNAATWPSGSPGHSWQNVSAGGTSLAHKGMLLAAKVLAAAAADLMTKPEILAQAREEFIITAAEGYDCPIGPEVVAKPQ